MKISNNKSNDFLLTKKWCFRWAKLLMSACLPIILGVFTLIYTIQQSTIAKDNREQDEKQANEIREENVYDKYLEDVTKFKLNGNINLQTVHVKTLNTLSQLNNQRKQSIIIFLYNIGFIHRDTPENERLILTGADLTGVKFFRSSTFHCQLDKIYLVGILASNIIFSHCRLSEAVFDQSTLINAEFINCSMLSSNFISVDLTDAKFIGEANNAAKINFANSKLIRLNASLPIRDANLTNTDTFNSYIKFSTDVSKTNYFLNTRLPNGTFSIIDTSQLIKDGSAELKKYWIIRKGYAAIEYSNVQNETFNQWIPKAIDGNSYFKLFFNSRIYQDIDIRHFSLFINSGNAWFNLSAYLACPFSENRTDFTDIYLRFADENAGSIKNEIIVSSHGQTSFKYQNLIGHIPSNTLHLSLFLGLTIQNSSVLQTQPYCLIDDIRLNIFKKT